MSLSQKHRRHCRDTKEGLQRLGEKEEESTLQDNVTHRLPATHCYHLSGISFTLMSSHPAEHAIDHGEENVFANAHAAVPPARQTLVQATVGYKRRSVTECGTPPAARRRMRPRLQRDAASSSPDLRNLALSVWSAQQGHLSPLEISWQAALVCLQPARSGLSATPARSTAAAC